MTIKQKASDESYQKQCINFFLLEGTKTKTEA